MPGRASHSPILTAGWTEGEVAAAVLELTVAWRRWRRETRATEAQIDAAQRLHRQ